MIIVDPQTRQRQAVSRHCGDYNYDLIECKIIQNTGDYQCKVMSLLKLPSLFDGNSKDS